MTLNEQFSIRFVYIPRESECVSHSGAVHKLCNARGGDDLSSNDIVSI